MRAVVWLVLAAIGVLLLSILRLLQVLYQTHARPRFSTASTTVRNNSEKCRILVFLGSGGHTGEMLRLLCALDFDRYSPRAYFISSGDSLSLAKVSAMEKTRTVFTGQNDPVVCAPASRSTGLLAQDYGKGWSITEIPRARNVHQSFFTAPFTTLRSLAVCLSVLTLPSFTKRQGTTDLILLNGPGSCVPLVIAAFLPRVSLANTFDLLALAKRTYIFRFSVCIRHRWFT